MFYIIATPIGNPRDITLRALDILTSVDLIACEDTRVTEKLLKHHQIQTKLTSYHEFSTEQKRDYILNLLKAGQSIALVSDAGMPLISDPGYKLVQDIREAGIAVTCVPGPSSVVTALVLSGLPTYSFLFDGFLPNKQAARKQRLISLKSLDATLIFFEAARRVADVAHDMYEVFGERQLVIARELTKTYEEVLNMPLSEAVSYTKNNQLRGEIVLLVAPPTAENQLLDEETLDAELKSALRSMSVKDAAHMISIQYHWPKKQVYARALALKNMGSHL